MKHQSDSRDRTFPVEDPEDAVTAEVNPDSATLDAAAAGERAKARGSDVLWPGTRLAERYEIVDLVHSGGMGHVYKALDTTAENVGDGEGHVAIKMLRRAVADRLDARRVLEQEASRARRLSHPNVVRIVAFDEHDGRFFLVMEWLEGESVNDLLRRMTGQRVAPHLARHIIHGTAAALRHAHAHGIVHADVNPSNIFITETHEIRLLDFGVARHLGGEDGEADPAPRWVTRPYASPDVLDGQSPVVQDDVYSLGCVAYRLLGGRHPFSGRTALEARDAGTALHPIPGLADAEWQTIRAALAFDRDDRPASVDGFLAGAPAEPASVGGARGLPGGPAVWLPVAAAVLLALGVWWAARQSTPEPPPVAAPPAEDVQAVSPIEEALATAAAAMAAQRYVTPDGDDARTRYREILAIDAANAQALAGLRAISDVYVERAEQALRAGEPEAAVAALATATDTDAANPAIGIATDLLLAEAGRLLAEARAAASAGDPARATALLETAERYGRLEPAEIEAVRLAIAAAAEEQALLAGIAAAEAQMTAGRLISPAGNNARDALLALAATHGADPRLGAARERLGALLLARAALATADARFDDAEAAIDATASLGVMTGELAEARASLQRARESDAASAVAATDGTEDTVPAPVSRGGDAAAATAAAAPSGQDVDAPGIDTGPATAAASANPLPADSDVAGSADPAPAAAPVDADASRAPGGAVADADGAVSDGPAPAAAAVDTDASTAPRGAVADEVDAGAGLAGAAAAVASTAAETAAEAPARTTEPDASPPAAEDETPAPPETRSLSDLRIEEYVAPQYPRGAWNRGQTGFVELRFKVRPDGSTADIEIVRSEPGDVFVDSASEAVGQWRFEQRDDELTAQVTLRFER